MKPLFLDKKTKLNSKSAPRSGSPTAHPPRRKLHADTEDGDFAEPGFFSSLTKYTFITLLLTIGIGTLLYVNREKWGISHYFEHLPFKENTPKPDPETYAALISELEQNRILFKQLYLNAGNTAEKENIIKQASHLLEETLPKMMRCWLGHPWDYHGTATIPGKGKIACGYYIAVIMRDAGFKINRSSLAQQASQNIIRTFVDSKQHFEIKTNTPYSEYVADITKRYEGIHIVGLDSHVAFIVIKYGKMRFIHSKGQAYVVDEDEASASTLEKSRYRVISNISRNKNVIKKWLLEKPFSTVTNNSSS